MAEILVKNKVPAACQLQAAVDLDAFEAGAAKALFTVVSVVLPVLGARVQTGRAYPQGRSRSLTFAPYGA